MSLILLQRSAPPDHIDGGIDDQFQDGGCDDAADHGRGDPLHDVGPAPSLNMIGIRPARITLTVMILGLIHFTAPNMTLSFQ